MIRFSKTKIMVVPDFGVGVGDEAMVALKKAIENRGEYAVKVVDLPAIVHAEHEGEDLTEAKIIEFAARKLEQLASCSDLIWDGSDKVEQIKTEHRIVNLRKSSERAEKKFEPQHRPEEDKDEEQFYLCRIGDELEVVDEDELMELMEEFSDNSDVESDDYEWGEPNAIVVFGKSAMLTGGLGQKNVLFINPVYDSEWPWKKQYYADRKLVGQYHWDKYKYERGFMETVLWMGNERTRPWIYSRRYGLITDSDYIGDFWDEYPRMAEVNRDLENDTTGLAKFICDFASDELTYPLDEVYEAIKQLPGRDFSRIFEVCDFIEPVRLGDITALGIRFGAPMSNGQSTYKLQVSECDYTRPLEIVHTRRELNALRDAIVRAGESRESDVPERKRILIVPDYFTPYNAPNVKELYNHLTSMGYYVAIYVHGESLEKSRTGIERRCKVKPFDLIVTLETGCLVATRITNCPRIFVNPNWTVWKSMKCVLGNFHECIQSRKEDNNSPFYTYYINRGEIAMARQMAERAYIKSGNEPVYGWFSEDADPELSEEHLKRFNTAIHIPHFKITTEEGMIILARDIQNIIFVEDNDD